MDDPALRVQYVTTSDGYRLAYFDSTHGRPIVLLPQLISHLHIYWNEDTWVRPWLHGLARDFRLIHYNGRGQGMSTRGLSRDFDVMDLLEDLETVVNHLSLEKFVLMGVQPFGHTAVRFALDHPDRVDALVLMSAPMTLASWALMLLLPLAETDWGAMLRLMAGASSAGDVSASVRRQEQSINQADYVTLLRSFRSSILDGFAGRLQTPTLILHPRQSLNMAPEESMLLAATIPRARLTLIDGATPMGDAAPGLAAIAGFLSDLDAEKQSSPPHESEDFGLREIEALTARERDVLGLISEGKSNQQIADELVISQNTVRRHVAHILQKTRSANRAQAAVIAHELHLL